MDDYIIFLIAFIPSVCVLCIYHYYMKGGCGKNKNKTNVNIQVV
jgi:hypothetical protein